MIQNSFVFLDKIGPEKERRLWEQGIYSWEAFLTTPKIKGISARAKPYYDRRIREARRALFNNDSGYFANNMPLSEQWRLYEFFREETVYLDIETDGVNETDDITVVGLFDRLNTKSMIRGVNLDFAALKEELQQYKMIVTFNGSVFDVPFIKKRHGNVLPNIPHFDLRFCCRRVGLRGGLKEIEKKLGIVRSNNIVQAMHGGDAALLHKLWRGSGDDYYLNTLAEYNEEDVINLRKIAEYAYERLKEDAEADLAKPF